MLTSCSSLHSALKEFFDPLRTDDSRTDFFAVYRRESGEFDRDYAKKYDEDLNTSLIFERKGMWPERNKVETWGEGRNLGTRSFPASEENEPILQFASRTMEMSIGDGTRHKGAKTPKRGCTIS